VRDLKWGVQRGGALCVTCHSPFAKGDTGGLASGDKAEAGMSHPYLRCSPVNKGIGILNKRVIYMTSDKHILVALVNDRPGVLNRVASMLRRRGFKHRQPCGRSYGERRHFPDDHCDGR